MDVSGLLQGVGPLIYFFNQFLLPNVSGTVQLLQQIRNPSIDDDAKVLSSNTLQKSKHLNTGFMKNQSFQTIMEQLHI